ncbi:Nn.00g024700.m01.CDS01 [Neocucurbitaria sp. VM-36]
MSKRYGDITQPAPALPQPQLQELRKGVAQLLPLSRRGYGPGLIILVPDHTKQLSIDDGVPSPLVKWAEEGYVVVEIQSSALADEGTLKEAVNAIRAYIPTIPEIVGAIVYANSNDFVVSYTNEPAPLPLLLHLVGVPSKDVSRTETVTEYYYPFAVTHKFAIPFQPDFQYSTEAVSHTRNLTFLKKHMCGPNFDLEDIWEEHTYYEFQDRSVEWTMSTMVQEPYVNHVPTLTGGIGRVALTRFYRENFIFNNSADTELELISRTVGIDRVVDEFLFKFTHNMKVDWLLPGVPPTFKKASVPFTAIVNIRGDRLYHEHIAWDQGTLLRQLGLMPEYLPYPYPLATERATQVEKSVEYQVPVEGVKTAHMLRERNSVPSNEMFKFEVRQATATEM